MENPAGNQTEDIKVDKTKFDAYCARLRILRFEAGREESRADRRTGLQA
jgi:hypothetical protein